MTCKTCGRNHEEFKGNKDLWGSLSFVGIQRFGYVGIIENKELVLELRNAPCGSTLAIEVEISTSSI